MRERSTDVLIVGGGLGGVAAALSVARMGFRAILTDEGAWLGGQLTAQAVPPDESHWIETEGCTATYRQLRERIRAYYRRNYPLTPAAAEVSHFNPGMGNVSRICHEPRVGLAAIEELIAPFRANQTLLVLLRRVPVGVEMQADRALAVHFRSLDENEEEVIQAAFILDATELGDLLPLAEMEHVIGAESQAETGELHALNGPANPLDQQAISWCFALDYHPGADHTIPKPRDYDFWRTYRPDFWPNQMLSWVYPDPKTLEPVHRPIFIGDSDAEDSFGLWHFRRIFYRGHYPKGLYPSDITLVNWPQIDYFLGPIVGVRPEERFRHLEGALQLSLSFLYWMQTEAPRPEGGAGYPGLRLRPDILGTEDGFARQVYIRESRRIKAEFTILEQHLGVEARSGRLGAEEYPDSIGIGSYRIDLHPSTAGRNYIDISNWPFQIPLGALLPVRVENLLPAAKNIGTTHITNGCYRLHPVEWNIGEAAGALAAWSLRSNGMPRQVWKDPTRLADFQHFLSASLGFPLRWSETVRLTPKDF